MIRGRLLLVSIAITSVLCTVPALAQQTNAAPGATTPANEPPVNAAPASSVPAPADVPPVAQDPAPAADTAGAAADQPHALEQPAQPQAAPEASAVPAAVTLTQPRDLHDAVRFVESEGRHVTLFEKKGKQWQEVCTSPCYFTASPGPRDYAAPIKAGPATSGYRVAGKGIWLVNGDGLQADFKDRSQIRKIGIGVMVAGLVTLAFLAPALDAENRTAAKATVLSTSGVLTLSGLVMLLMKDRMQLSRCAGCNAASPRPAAP
jgi:hypothetical protein